MPMYYIALTHILTIIMSQRKLLIIKRSSEDVRVHLVGVYSQYI